jgi:hypothetical protein
MPFAPRHTTPMTSTVTISYDDSKGLLDVRPLLDLNIQAAFDWLAQHVVFQGTMDVEVVVVETETGRFAGSGPVTYRETLDGVLTYEQTSLAESRTGIDLDPSAPEFRIFIDPTTDYVKQLWWDPTPLERSPGEIPTDQTDGFSVVMHEILHGMGFVGWRDPVDGSLPADYQSVWDSLIHVDGSLGWFNGSATGSLVGEPVEVRFGAIGGGTHLGGLPTTQPYLESSIMNSYYFFLGERYLPGRLELSMLADMGWALRPSTLYHVVDPFDDLRTGVYAVGYGQADTITGSAAADRLEGRGGNDTLHGNGGHDVLLGGAGADRLNGRGGADRLVGGPGSDVVATGLDQAFDRVVFSAPLGPDNIDRVLQFDPLHDRLQLSDAVFTAAGACGPLAAGAWHAGAAATTPEHRIVYDAPSGRLYYDADGSGGGQALLFARLDAGTALEAADVWIV